MKNLYKEIRDGKGLWFGIGCLAVILLLTACGNGGEGDGGTADQQLYTCGMHTQVIQEDPGNCPICEMKLTPMKESKTTEADADEHTDMKHEDSMSASDGKKNKKVLYWRAPMDPTYISDEPGKSPMGMDLVPVYEGEEMQTGSTITIDPTTVQNMGVRTADVKRQPFHREIRTVGHIDYNEDALFAVNLKFDGWIETLHVSRTGEVVQKGQPLLSIYSPALVATQEEYLLAYRNKQKLAHTAFAQISRGATDLLQATRKRLEYWDITDGQIEKLERTGEVKKYLTIYSPANGVVQHKNAVEGAHVKAGIDLFRVADLSKVWVLAHIFEYELPWVEVGQKVDMQLPYVPGKRFQGEVEYIYPYLDQKTRDVKIRIVFHNPDLELKPQMYANITIEASSEQEELVVPSEAVVRSGTRNLIFLALGGGKFRPQEVILGPEGEDGMIKVAAGLQEGQTIVTSAQFLLDSESRLQTAIQKLVDSRAK